MQGETDLQVDDPGACEVCGKIIDAGQETTLHRLGWVRWHRWLCQAHYQQARAEGCDSLPAARYEIDLPARHEIDLPGEDAERFEPLDDDEPVIDPDDWVSQTALGRPYGLSAVKVGNLLVKAGFKDPVTKAPTEAAYLADAALEVPTRWGEKLMWSRTATAHVFTGRERVLPAGVVLLLRVADIEIRDHVGRYGPFQMAHLAFRVLAECDDEVGRPDLVGQTIWGAVPSYLSSAPENQLRQWIEAIMGIKVAIGSHYQVGDLVGRVCRGVVGLDKLRSGSRNEIKVVLPAGEIPEAAPASRLALVR